MIKNVLMFIWNALGVCYVPVYILSWLLHKVARLVLAVSYFGMLDYRTGKDILKYMFTWHGKY